MKGHTQYDYRNQGLPGFEKANYVVPPLKKTDHQKTIEAIREGAQPWVDRSAKGYFVKIGGNQVSGFFHAQSAASDYMNLLLGEARRK